MMLLAVHRSTVEQANKNNALYMGCEIDLLTVLEDGYCWLAHNPILPPEVDPTPPCYGRSLEDVLIRYLGPDVSKTQLPEIEDHIELVLFFKGMCKVVLIDDGEDEVPAHSSLVNAVNFAILRQKYKHEKGKPNANL